jgi:hypothetical protein
LQPAADSNQRAHFIANSDTKSGYRRPNCAAYIASDFIADVAAFRTDTYTNTISNSHSVANRGTGSSHGPAACCATAVAFRWQFFGVVCRFYSSDVVLRDWVLSMFLS